MDVKWKLNKSPTPMIALPGTLYMIQDIDRRSQYFSASGVQRPLGQKNAVKFSCNATGNIL